MDIYLIGVFFHWAWITMIPIAALLFLWGWKRRHSRLDNPA